jgi:phosphate transport system substrate-binding protein
MEYEAIGSHEGLAQVVSRQVDFAATASPLSAPRLRERNLLQFPCMICPVAFVVDLPGLAKDQLRLTGETIADLYLGKITKWNDPRLAQHNPGLRLPNLAVTPVHRSDSCGTTLLTTTFLSRVSEAWRNGPKAGSVIRWPHGKGGQMNAGVAQVVAATPGAVGYVTEASEVAKTLATTQIRNQFGKFVKPETDAFYAAVNATDWSVPGFGVDMVDLDQEDVWPIIGPAFALIPNNPTAGMVEAVRNTMKFFDGTLTKGEDILRRTGNASIPEELVAFIHEDWAAIKGPDGQPLWKL